MPFAQASRIAALYRYPIKGLTAEPLTSVNVVPGEAIFLDRAYADRERSPFSS